MKRFWDKVIKTNSCWLWTACKRPNGYGVFYLKGKWIGAHRMAWILTHNEIPKHLEICHKCDNRACVNPDHLFLGTRSDNMLDASQKGRLHGPEKRMGRAKLNPELAKEIRILYATGEFSYRKLARRFNVGHTTIVNLLHNRTWIQ